MSKPRHLAKKPRRNWPLTILLLAILLGLTYACFHAFLQAPEQSLPMEDLLPAQGNQSPEEAAAAEALRSHRERKEQFYTILVSGVDDGHGGSDTNILVAVNAKEGYVYGVSIPRDTKAHFKGKDHKINFAYNSGGMDLLAEVLSDQLGIPVDYTVQVNLKGFVALVDAIGGVQFDVPIDMNYEDPYQDLYIHIPKGPQRLTGEKALQVVRFRAGYASQDIGRMETQQNFLKAAAKQTLTLSNIDKVDDFVKIFNQHVETDLSLGNLAWLGKTVMSMGAENIHFSTLPGEWKSPYIHLDREAVLTLVNEYLNPYVEDRLLEDLHIPD